MAAMPDPPCKHERTQLIAKDDNAEYIECLDCGEIFEAGEWNDSPDFDESFSDA
jgi:Zn ribbon nucleic-acid-binding protein